MLVKQVLPWSVRVWKFAVTFLVGVVLCFNQDEVDQMYDEVTKSSKTFLDYQMKLNSYEALIIVGESWVDSVINEMVAKANDGDKLIRFIGKVRGFDFEQIFQKDAPNLEWVPYPIGPNLYKLARVVRYEEALSRAVNALKVTAESWKVGVLAKQYLHTIKTSVSNLCADVNFPYIDPKGRYVANLRKETVEVTWENVSAAFEIIKSRLKEYVPRYLERNEEQDVRLVAEWLLQRRGRTINVHILDELDFLCETNRIYRLAGSPAHTIYVTDHPEALHFVRRLRLVVRNLNDFADMLYAGMRARNWEEEFATTNPMAMLYELRTKNGSSTRMWSKWLLYDLVKFLNCSTGNIQQSSLYSLKSQFNKDLISWFLKTFAEVEEISQMYHTYELISKNISDKHTLSEDVFFVAAFMDKNLNKLSDILKSTDVRAVCRVRECWNFFRDVSSLQQLFCKLSDKVVSYRAKEDEVSFYSVYSNKFPHDALKERESGDRMSFGVKRYHTSNSEAASQWKTVILRWLKDSKFFLKTVLEKGVLARLYRSRS